MYTCGEIEELLDIYTDGELDERRRPCVESHLQLCPHCSRLARLRESEARLVRSSDPVPALSPGFTRQVMSNLCRIGRPRARGERFFPLTSVITRPWVAPALAGLLLLVTVSWAASGRLTAINHKLAANYDRQQPSQLLPAAPEPLAAGSNNQILKDSVASGTPSGVAPGPAQSSANTNDDLEGTADSKATANSANSKGAGSSNEPLAPQEAAGADKSRIAFTLPQESRGVGVTTPDTGSAPAGKTPEPRTLSLAPQQVSYDELERQGYTVFEPGYLPPGYSRQPYAAQPQDQGLSSGSPAATPAGKSSLSLAYRNDQTGEAITLEILPLNGSASPPPPESTEQPKAAGAPAGQSGVVNQITWTGQKNSGNFVLKLTGSVSFEELDKVRDSIK